MCIKNMIHKNDYFLKFIKLGLIPKILTKYLVKSLKISFFFLIMTKKSNMFIGEKSNIQIIELCILFETNVPNQIRIFQMIL